MLNFTEAAVRVVAADCSATIEDYDRTFASSLRMAANAVEGFKGSGMPIAHSQKLYRTFVEGVDGLISSRAKIASAVAQLTVMQRNSNCAETATGCPWGWEGKVADGPSAGLVGEASAISIHEQVKAD